MFFFLKFINFEIRCTGACSSFSVEVKNCGSECPSYCSPYSISWLLMTKWCKEPGHQQQWYRPIGLQYYRLRTKRVNSWCLVMTSFYCTFKSSVMGVMACCLTAASQYTHQCQFSSITSSRTQLYTFSAEMRTCVPEAGIKGRDK